MGEKPKRIPTSKDQRRPLLDAARAGKTDLIDRALAGLLEGHIEDIRGLLRREWGALLTNPNRILLLERLDLAQKTVTSTHNAVAQASGVITPQSLVTPTNPEGIDYAALTARYETEIADLKAKLTKPSTAPAPATPTQAAQPHYTQAATLPHTNYAPPTANPGPSRGTRTTPVAPPRSTHVAEGMRR